MKVYVVQISVYENAELVDTKVEAVYTTHRDASQSLIDRGYEPYFEQFSNDDHLRFYLDNKYDNFYTAKIIEMKLKGYKDEKQKFKEFCENMVSTLDHLSKKK